MATKRTGANTNTTHNRSTKTGASSGKVSDAELAMALARISMEVSRERAIREGPAQSTDAGAAFEKVVQLVRDRRDGGDSYDEDPESARHAFAHPKMKNGTVKSLCEDLRIDAGREFNRGALLKAAQMLSELAYNLHERGEAHLLEDPDDEVSLSENMKGLAEEAAIMSARLANFHAHLKEQLEDLVGTYWFNN